MCISNKSWGMQVLLAEPAFENHCRAFSLKHGRVWSQALDHP